MNRTLSTKRILVLLLLVIRTGIAAAPAKPAGDPYGRENPRSAVTNFLEACHSGDYSRAAQYLDLRQIPARTRASRGLDLAKQLEAILNSDTRFDVLRLSQQPQGNPSDQTNPTIEHVTSISRDSQTFPIDLQRVELQPNQPVWIFSAQTVAEIPGLTPTTTESAIEARLPRFLVQTALVDTPIWKWFALLIVAFVLFFIFRLAADISTATVRRFGGEADPRRWLWIEAILDPAVVFCAVIVFRIAEDFIGPSALARLFIGRFLLLLLTASVAWGLVNLVDVFMDRLGRVLNRKQRIVSQSLLYLGRRFFKVLIICFAAITVLSNWGYDMTTILAGLGVGGIAVALAAQSTIANVFGGVSVIGAAPVSLGDFGKFGDVMGTVEDIGMRSTRIRTLARTVVSIPNSSFAGINLENYALRDKILFNPILQVKRTTPKDQIRHAMTAIHDALSQNKMVQLGPSPVRISGVSGTLFTVEIFAYVLTRDIEEFYKVEAELFLALDDVLVSSGIELV